MAKLWKKFRGTLKRKLKKIRQMAEDGERILNSLIKIGKIYEDLEVDDSEKKELAESKRIVGASLKSLYKKIRNLL